MDLTKKNYDSTFTRRVFVGVVSFLYDVLEIVDVIDGKGVLKKVPIYPSMAGEAQFISDLFLNHDFYCDVFTGKIDGNVRSIPSGNIRLNTVDLQTANVMSGFNRLLYQKEVQTEFDSEIRDFSARGELLPHEFTFQVEIRCGSANERFKVFDALVEQLWKPRKFFISYRGFAKIPCVMALPDGYTMDKKISFAYNDNDKRPELSFSLQLVSWRPIVDYTTAYHYNNTITKTTVRTVAKREEEKRTPGDEPV